MLGGVRKRIPYLIVARKATYALHTINVMNMSTTYPRRIGHFLENHEPLNSSTFDIYSYRHISVLIAYLTPGQSLWPFGLSLSI